MDLIHTRPFRVASYETDFRGQAQTVALLNYLQEAAREQAAQLGFSVVDLFKRGLTWVLSRYHVEILRHPALGETINVRTWPSGAEGVFWLRDFEVVDARGDRIAAATSSWIVLELATRQPAPAGDHLPKERILERRAVKSSFPRLPACGEAEREATFRAGFHDLDLNDHVNNAVYVRWALETATENRLRTSRPTSVEVAYRAEAFLGGEVLGRVASADGNASGDTLIHGLFNAATGQELTRLRTTWAPRAD